MEQQEKNILRIKFEDFSGFLERELMNKFSPGLEGLKDRF